MTPASRTRSPSFRRRGVLVAAVAAIAALALSACTGTERATTLDPAAKVQLTWWTGQAGEPQETLSALAAEFEKLHPNVSIDVSSGAPTTGELLQKLTATFGTDRYPDISYAYGAWMGRLAESGKTLDYTEKIKDPAVAWEEFAAPARITASPGGKVIGFPALVDVLSLVYNKKLFDEKHLKYPANDWTWDDFRRAAKALTDPDRQVFGTAAPVVGDEDTVWRLWPQLWQAGGQISDESRKPMFNSPAGIKALELWQAMAVDDKSVYVDQTGVKHVAMFAGGNLGMLITGPWSLPDIIQGGTDYGVAMLPGVNGDHQSVSGPDIWVGFDHQDANRAHWTFEFLRWLTSTEIDPRWSLATGNLPLRSSEQNAPEYREFIGKYPGMDVMVENLAKVKQARPTDSSYVTLSRNVGEAMARALQGAAPAAEALQQAADRTIADIANGR